MTTGDTLPKRILIYGLLVAGSLIFSLPFLWMVATSMKVDRELFTSKLHILPMAPEPAAQSPYVDLREFRDLDGPKMEEAVTVLREAISADVTTLPEGRQAAALGIYSKLVRTRPPAFWEAPNLPENLRSEATLEAAREGMRSAYREFGIGALRVESLDGKEALPLLEAPFSERWRVATDAETKFVPHTDPRFPGGTLAYAFGDADRMILWQNIPTPFPAERFTRAVLALQPDDSWHKLTTYIRAGSQWYVAEQPFYLAFTSAAATEITWQLPSAADEGGQVKTWTLLDKLDAPPKPVADLAAASGDGLAMFLVIDRSSGPGAWWGKLARNYRLTFSQIPFWRYFATSMFVVILNIVFAIFSCSLVAFAFARLTWPGRDTLFAIVLATMMVPAQVTMIPQFMIYKSLGWYNTLTPLWVTALFANAFFVFLMRQFMKGIPRDLEEAARIDGCGFWRLYFHIILPLMRPALATIAIFTFLASWNDFMQPLIYLNDERLYTLSLGLYSFRVSTGTGDQALLMAACFLMLLPVILLFFFAQRYFIQGITITGMK